MRTCSKDPGLFRRASPVTEFRASVAALAQVFCSVPSPLRKGPNDDTLSRDEPKAQILKVQLAIEEF